MKNIYSTKDFYLSCLLKANKFKLIDSQKHSDNTVFFNFQVHDEKQLREIVDSFVNMIATVNVRQFTWAMNDIRNELRKWN